VLSDDLKFDGDSENVPNIVAQWKGRVADLKLRSWQPGFPFLAHPRNARKTLLWVFERVYQLEAQSLQNGWLILLSSYSFILFSIFKVTLRNSGQKTLMKCRDSSEILDPEAESDSS
jgi:hypothetical protein